MSESNVIDFTAYKAKRDLSKVLDTHEAVLDVGDVVLTAADLTDTIEVTEDSIIIKVEDDG